LPIRDLSTRFIINSEGIPMSISAVTSTSNLAATYSAPAVQQKQAAAPQTAAPKADTVTISKQAQALASDGDPAATEIKEGAAEKATETLRGKA
jgi:hypothetical protein